MSGQEPNPAESEQKVRISKQQIKQIWLKRCRGILIGQYASDEVVDVYGLTVQRVGDAGGDYWDVFKVDRDDDGEVEQSEYLDTIDVSHYSRAGQLLQQFSRYYPDDDPPDESDVEEKSDEISPTFQ